MENKTDIEKWLTATLGNVYLFVSIRFNTPPATKEALCKRCRCIFRHLFIETLGRHWHKMYSKYFSIIGFQEYGYKHNMHAHFLIGINKTDLSAPQIIESFKNISNIIKMDIWNSPEDKQSNPKLYPDDIMIKQAYSKGALTYSIKTIKVDQKLFNINSDNIILDTEMF
jgi:hypothetical protein